MIDIALIDNYISQHGQFCLLDWLLSENLISYTNYEAWRYGQRDTLEECVNLNAQELQALVSQTYTFCRQLKLSLEPQSYYLWGGEQGKHLCVSQNQSLNEALSASWVSSKDLPQMDLFMDNTAAIVEGQVVDSLANRSFEQAENALQQLSEFNSSHKKLGGYRDLINYGMHIELEPTIDIDALVDEFTGLDAEVAPLAKELLASKQRDYLAFAWRRVATNYAAQLKKMDAQGRGNYSYALLQIPDWTALEECLQDDTLLYQSALLMERLAKVYSYTKKTPLFVLMWGLMFERFPEDAESMLGQSGSILVKHWDGFLEFDDTWSEKYFIGYLFIQQPGLIHWLEKLPKQEGSFLKQPVNQWVLGLVKARLKGECEKHYRKQLKNTCPSMLDCYLNKRDWQASLRKGL